MSTPVKVRVLKWFLMKFWGSTQNHCIREVFSLFWTKMIPVRSPDLFALHFLLLFHSFRFFFFNILSTACKNDAWSHGTFHRFFTGSRENLKHTERFQSAAYLERCVGPGICCSFLEDFKQQRCFFWSTRCQQHLHFSECILIRTGVGVASSWGTFTADSSSLDLLSCYLS